MIRAVIVDDLEDATADLKRVANAFPNRLKIIAEFNTVDEAVKGILLLSPDLIFLDVELNDRTGFEVLEKLPTINVKVVFTTAYSKYAVRAFQYCALHYLLKPIDVSDFSEVLNRMENETPISKIQNQIQTLIYNNSVKNNEKRIIIESVSEGELIDPQNILYCLSHGNYTDICLSNTKRITSSKTLKHYEEILLDFNFFRVDQQALVNLNQIEKYTKGNPTYVIMSDKKRIKVSTYKKPLFLEKIKTK